MAVCDDREDINSMSLTGKDSFFFIFFFIIQSTEWFFENIYTPCGCTHRATLVRTTIIPKYDAKEIWTHLNTGSNEQQLGKKYELDDQTTTSKENA
jgi:hypothetical protein